MAGGASEPPPSDLEKLKQQQVIKRAQRLRGMGGYIPEEAYRIRKSHFIHKENGVLVNKPEKAQGADMMGDPSAMMGPLKKQVLSIVPQIAMGAFVNYFFDGFVLGKVPLPLSPRFRPMLQRGIDLGALDVSYFTSLSFYIVLLFSLRGVLALIFHENVVDETEMMRKQMQGGAMQPGFDAGKQYD